MFWSSNVHCNWRCSREYSSSETSLQLYLSLNRKLGQNNLARSYRLSSCRDSTTAEKLTLYCELRKRQLNYYYYYHHHHHHHHHHNHHHHYQQQQQQPLFIASDIQKTQIELSSPRVFILYSLYWITRCPNADQILLKIFRTTNEIEQAWSRPTWQARNRPTDVGVYGYTFKQTRRYTHNVNIYIYIYIYIAFSKSVKL